MKFNIDLNGKEYEVDVPSNLRLSQLLGMVMTRKSVKHNCGTGRCGYCLVLIDNTPIYSCLYPAYRAQGKKIITLEAILQKSEYSNIIKGFELANVDLCPNCAPARILLTYHQLEKNRELTGEMIENIIDTITCDCTDVSSLKEALYLAANFYKGDFD
ncbi:MAG: 2Fe-2S iron-sulfur cluster binding domain-containing protein [Spirochaetales bacterium]|nr:2Fe-2S iron-sulfur cluster binding domain-containing protein [Spirochaetales bacterium]